METERSERVSAGRKGWRDTSAAHNAAQSRAALYGWYAGILRASTERCAGQVPVTGACAHWPHG
jgi:hypothetical protein